MTEERTRGTNPMRRTIVHMARHFRYGGTETMILNICLALAEFDHVLVTPECWREQRLRAAGIDLLILDMSSGASLTQYIMEENPIAVFHHWYPEGYEILDFMSSELCSLGVKSFVVVHWNAPGSAEARLLGNQATP